METNESLEFHIPNILDYEKVAMERAASMAKRERFSEGQIEILKTVVSEVCINAMEHGNKMDSGMKVRIIITAGVAKLNVVIVDEGIGFKITPVDQFNPPSIEGRGERKKNIRG